MRDFKRFFAAVWGLSALLLGLGYLGVVHPAGDSFAVLRPFVAALFAASSFLVFRRPLLRWGICLLGLAALAHVLSPRVWPVPEVVPGLTLYQQNLSFRRTSSDALIASILESDADLVALQEVTEANASMLDPLRQTHPAQQFCSFAHVGGVSVLSRWPAIPNQKVCIEKRGLAAMQVASPYGPLWVVSIHLAWPWPKGQAQQLSRLEPLLAQLEGPIVIGGDFNAVWWSHAMDQVEAASRTRMVGPFRTTFNKHFNYPLAIDHVLASWSGPHEAIVMPRLGSDHHGVLARLSPPSP